MNVNFLYGIGILISSSLETYVYMLFPFIQSLLVSEFYIGQYNIGFWILFIAALSRPFGGWLFGAIGDKYGRKKALLLSMFLMGGSCLLLCALPLHSQIGNYAVIGLIFVRVLQVISVSGEHAGVGISLIETFNKNSKNTLKNLGLASGLVYLFSMFGSFLATFVVHCLSLNNWRNAYFLSVVLILFCFVLRFLPYQYEVTHSQNHANQNLLNNFVSCFLISASMSALFYLNTVFMPPLFCVHYKNICRYYLFLYMFATLFFGWISDFFEKLYLFIQIPCILLFFTLFYTLYFLNPYFHFINILLLAMLAGPSHAYFFKLFSNHNRYRGISISYSLGTSLIGASSPLISANLIVNLNFMMIYLLFLLTLPLIAVYLSQQDLINRDI